MASFFARFTVVSSFLLLVTMFLTLSRDPLISERKFYFHHSFVEFTSSDSVDDLKSRASNETTLVVITPTYNRSTQIPDLLRLKQTLMLVKNCFWILVEDAEQPNPKVQQYLSDYPEKNLLYTAVSTNSSYKELKGVFQRNKAIQYLQDAYSSKNNFTPMATNPAVVIFADDDNTYDSNFLEKLKSIKRLSLFNVGFIAASLFEGPIVEENKIIGFQTDWHGNRQFCVDMAGFAIHIDLFREKNFPKFNKDNVLAGFQETHFLSKFGLRPSEAEYIHGDLGVHVWHTKTQKPNHAPHPRYLHFFNGSTIDTRSKTEPSN